MRPFFFLCTFFYLVFFSASHAAEPTPLQFISGSHGKFLKVKDVKILRRELLNRPELPAINGQLQWLDIEVTATAQVGGRTDATDLKILPTLEKDPQKPREESLNPVYTLDLVTAKTDKILSGNTSGQFVASTKEVEVSFKLALVWGGFGALSSKDREMKFYLGAKTDKNPKVTAFLNQKENKLKLKVKNPEEEETEIKIPNE